MATATLPAGPMTLPGLTSPLTKDILIKSRQVYNNFDACPNNQHPDQAHIDSLGSICRSYGAQHLFGIHLIHRHGWIPPHTVMVGVKIKELNCIWTKPTKVEDLTNIRTHVFCVSNGTLVPYEFREGPSVDVSKLDRIFFSKVADYIVRHGLENILGLQVCGEGSGGKTEFELQDSNGLVTTAMFPKPEANYGAIIQTTGWHFGREPEQDEEHSETTKGTHRVFVKFPLSDDVEALKMSAVEEGLIKS